MSFFDNLTGFAGEVGGFAGNLGSSLAQIGNAAHQVQNAFGGGGSGMPVWGAGTPFVAPSQVPQNPMSPPTASERLAVQPLLLVAIAGVAIYLAAKK